MRKERFLLPICINGSVYEDCGLLLLPESYNDDGTPTRLVISCHGAGGTVTTDDSQVEEQVMTAYLLANGYAVLDVNGLPAQYAAEQGIDLRNNIGAPFAVDSYVATKRGIGFMRKPKLPPIILHRILPPFPIP